MKIFQQLNEALNTAHQINDFRKSVIPSTVESDTTARLLLRLRDAMIEAGIKSVHLHPIMPNSRQYWFSYSVGYGVDTDLSEPQQNVVLHRLLEEISHDS